MVAMVKAGVELAFDVAFHHGRLVPAPLNLGPLPSIALDTSGVSGLHEARVEVVQRGAPPVNFSFAEQRITLNASRAVLSSLGGDARGVPSPQPTSPALGHCSPSLDPIFFCQAASR